MNNENNKQSKLIRLANEFGDQVQDLYDWQTERHNACVAAIAIDNETGEATCIAVGEGNFIEEGIFALIKSLPTEARHRLTLALAELFAREHREKEAEEEAATSATATQLANQSTQASMRPIKFRGKNLKGEWLCGYYHAIGEKHFICKGEPFEEFSQIDPKTLGQFTGCYTDEGAEVYEGDIIQFPDCSTADIMFEDEAFQCFDHKRGRTFYIPCYYFEDEARKILVDCTVIGNIHDHPELITPQKSQTRQVI